MDPNHLVECAPNPRMDNLAPTRPLGFFESDWIAVSFRQQNAYVDSVFASVRRFDCIQLGSILDLAAADFFLLLRSRHSVRLPTRFGRPLGHGCANVVAAMGLHHPSRHNRSLLACGHQADCTACI